MKFAALVLLALSSAIGVFGDTIDIDHCEYATEKEGDTLILESRLVCRGGGADGIIILHSHTKLDCNGYPLVFKGRCGGDGNHDHQCPGYDGIIVSGDGVTDVVVENCIVKKFPEDGIIVIDGAQAKLVNCSAKRNKRHGLRVQDDDSFADVTGSTFAKNDVDGIIVDPGASANIEDSKLKYNGRFGLHVDGDDTSVEVEDSRLKENGKADIFLSDGASLHIDNMDKALEMDVSTIP